MQNLEENYKKYTGWTVYHATNRPTWQYKKGGGAIYYRSVKNLIAREAINASTTTTTTTTTTTHSSARDTIFKHSIVFLLDSLNLSEAVWSEMEEQRASYRAIRGEIKLVDLRATVVSTKRKAVVYQRCVKCDSQISGSSAYCRPCTIAQAAGIKKIKLKEIKRQREAIRSNHELLAEIEELKRELEKTKRTVSKILVDQEKLELAKAREKEQFLRTVQKKEAEQEQLQATIEVMEESSYDAAERIESIFDSMCSMKEEMLSEEKKNFSAILKSFQNVSNQDRIYYKKLLEIENSLKGRQKEFNKYTELCDTLAAKLKRSMLNISPSSSTPFGIALGNDIWYYGIYRCSSAKFQDVGTAIERQGNIATYNIALMPTINNILDCEIPIVHGSDIAGKGVSILLENLGYIFDAVPRFQFASVDIVYKESTTKHLSIRKNKDLLIPLLKVYTIEVDTPENVAMLTTKNIFQLKAEEYQQLFLKVFYFHLSKGRNQTYDSKDNNTSSSKSRATYFTYERYDFYELDSIKMAYTKHQHGRGHEMLPVHIQLHTYVHTYKYEWQEPRLGLENNDDGGGSSSRKRSKSNRKDKWLERCVCSLCMGGI